MLDLKNKCFRLRYFWNFKYLYICFGNSFIIIASHNKKDDFMTHVNKNRPKKENKKQELYKRIEQDKKNISPEALKKLKAFFYNQSRNTTKIDPTHPRVLQTLIEIKRAERKFSKKEINRIKQQLNEDVEIRERQERKQKEKERKEKEWLLRKKKEKQEQDNNKKRKNNNHNNNTPSKVEKQKKPKKLSKETIIAHQSIGIGLPTITHLEFSKILTQKLGYVYKGGGKHRKYVDDNGHVIVFSRSKGELDIRKLKANIKLIAEHKNTTPKKIKEKMFG